MIAPAPLVAKLSMPHNHRRQNDEGKVMDYVFNNSIDIHVDTIQL
ncbi:hypothetical protein OPW32_24795 [Vibrio europaeus]|nr:hypothetical protein [Vibrio europaeus]MDC5852417.1 hypothetical protein [Vibrio europaeus]